MQPPVATWRPISLDNLQCDDELGLALQIFWISRFLMAIHPSKVSIQEAIDLALVIIWIQDQIVISGLLQVITQLLQCQFLGALGTEHVPCTAVNSIGDVRISVTRQIQQHSNDAAIAEGARRFLSIFILD